jgi:hypothetical protein
VYDIIAIRKDAGVDELHQLGRGLARGLLVGELEQHEVDRSDLI